MRGFLTLSVVLLSVLAAGRAWAQRTVVEGLIWDSTYQETMPLVRVHFVGSDKAVLSDFDGRYRIEIDGLYDSLAFETVGYLPAYRRVERGKAQVLNVSLVEDMTDLDEVVIEGQENPAFPILRKAIAAKGRNDLRRAERSYSQESYNRLELSLTSLSAAFKERKAMRQLQQVLGDDYLIVDSTTGQERLPVYLSETISELHWRKEPLAQKEIVRATRITGVGVSDGSLVSQMVGASFHLYNFYDNWVNILEKEFASPLAESWRSTYWYILEDSLETDSGRIYHISFEPKRPSELCFTGQMWIDAQTYGLRRIRLGVSPQVNLNWLDSIGFDLYYGRSPAGATFVQTSDIEVRVSDLGGMTQALVVHARQENRLYDAGREFPRKFFDVPIEVDPLAQRRSSEYWAEKRPHLTATEEQMFARIDTLKVLPVVRSYIEIANTILYGYKKLGPIEVGPYAYALALNDIEGVRVRLGLRTNEDFSGKFELGAFAAYGTLDERWKGDGYFKWIPSKRRWTEIEWATHHDLDRLGLTGRLPALNEAASRWGTQRGGYYHTRHRLSASRQISKSIQLTAYGQWRYLDPTFEFAYLEEGLGQSSTITTSEAVFQIKYGWHHLYLRNGNRRLDFGPDKGPLVTLTYTRGLRGVLGGEFDYNKLDLQIEQDLPMGKFGRALYVLGGGQVFDPVPYPLLEVHLGNNSPFYNYLAFNLLRPFELVSDRYASFQYIHHFEGLILSRVPILRRTNWRLVANYSALVGDLSAENRALTAPDAVQLGGLSQTPYMEVGYGIENIFRLFRVQAFHRLTYRDGPNPRNWGILGTIQFLL